jgi:hypothetical protein
MPEEWMKVGSQIGGDMFEVLHQRLQAEFGSQVTASGRMGPTVILVASVLRDPVARGFAVDDVVGFAAQRLRRMLELTVSEGSEA